MSYAKINSRCFYNGRATQVCVEILVRLGNSGCTITGLPNSNVKESIDRVSSALIASGYQMPEQHITINLTPATIPKSGSHLDLAIALAILIASKQISCALTRFEVFGELGLNGDITGNSSLLGLFFPVWQEEKYLIYPKTLNNHVKFFDGIKAICCANLISAIECLENKKKIILTETCKIPEKTSNPIMFAGIKGLSQCKRALSIAAAGGHHVLMIGPPGMGKSLLAKSLHEIMPELTQKQAIETMCINGEPPNRKPSFRAPHHSITSAGLIGGGLPIQIGEITKAHLGLLFTDELAEYSKQTIEMLREPVETGEICLVRSGMTCKLPCCFQWVAALNPCPCGMYGHSRCRCNFIKRQAYINKLSSPLIDRFAIGCKVNHEQDCVGEYHFSIAEINSARAMQLEHWQCCSQRLNHKQVSSIKLPNSTQAAWNYITKQLSERQKQQLLKVALTISYLEAKPSINKDHIFESFSYLPQEIISGYLTCQT